MPMEDFLERQALIKELGFTFQKALRNDFIEATINNTNFIPLTYFTDCCATIKKEAQLPYNLSQAIIAVYHRLKPRIEHKQTDCRKCGNIGLVVNQLFNPFLEWVSPCDCPRGQQYDWMNRDTDRDFVRHLHSRGVKFKGMPPPPNQKPVAVAEPGDRKFDDF